MSIPTQSNFQVWWNHKDWFYPTQRLYDRPGDVGEVSDKYKERAYKQFKEHSFHKLAEIQSMIGYLLPIKKYTVLVALISKINFLSLLFQIAIPNGDQFFLQFLSEGLDYGLVF